jgi:hypothetical protein
MLWHSERHVPVRLRSRLAARAWSSAAREGLRAAGRIFVPAVREEAPEGQGPGHGALKKSIRFATTEQGQTITLTIQGKKYGQYVIKGTRAHDIEPRANRGPRGRASALSFVWGGRRVFFRRVHHPGTKPNPFPARAYARVRGAMMNAIHEALARVMR